MATSLAEQLRRLQTPQSSQFVDTRKRDSILFTQKEAATKSRETIYEIGLSGLQELIEMNSAFAEFESTLFDYTSKEIQRAVETKDVNVLLNKNIKRFLFHLSPYFLIPSTHKCIEWLIRRFNINLYNKEEFMMLILPYHQTNMFVRCIQTMNFDDPSDKWIFLADVKKSSTPLSKYAIWNHGASFPAFLEFVGKFTYDAVKEFGQRSGTLQTMISFYLTTVVGTLEQASVVNENLILAVVKYLIKTYKSNVIDYTAAGYMITAHLLTKTKLIVKVLSEIIERILSNVQPLLAQNVFLIFVLMFQTQSSELEISNASLEKLIEFKWSLKVLGQIQSEGNSTINFQKALIRAIMKKVQGKDDKFQQSKEFCENLLSEIDFNDDDAGVVIRTVLESYIQEEKPQSEMLTSDNEVISLDSDDDDYIPFKSQEITTWYSNILKSLEHRYPMAFDQVVKDVMTSNPRKKRNCLKNVLGFLLKVTCASDLNTTSVFESLYHHNPHIRTEAVSYLVENIEKLSLASENHEILKLSISERINDDNPIVVAEVLKINSSVLIEILGETEFVAKLSKVLLKYWNKPERWNEVCRLALDKITTNSKKCDQNFLFMVLLPFLFPKTDNELNLAQAVVNSEFGKSLKLPGSKEKNSAKMSSLMNDYMLSLKVFSTESILNIMKSTFIDHQGTGNVSAHFAIYALAVSLLNEINREPSSSLDIFKCTKEVLKSSKLSNKSSTDHSSIKDHQVPISVLEFLIQNLLKSTNFVELNAKMNFKSQEDDCKLKFEIFEYLVEIFFTTDSENRVSINKIIKLLLNYICGGDQTSKIQFLAQFCLLHAVNCENLELQIRAMQLLNKALMNFSVGDKKGAKNFSNEFFENITISLAAKSSKVREAGLQIVEQVLKLEIASNWKFFFEKVIERKNEILMDCEQISLMIYLMISGKKKSAYSKQIIEIILASIADDSNQDYIQSELLLLLKHLTDRQVLDTMALVTTKLIENSSRHFDENQSVIIKLVLMKINSGTISSLWNLVVKSVCCHRLMCDEEGKILTPSILVLQAIENDIFVKLHPDHKMELFNAIVKCSMIELPKIIQAARKAFQNIDLDCKIVRDILKKMFTIEQRKGGKIIMATYASDDWRFGIVLLELIQTKSKGMKNQHELIVPLFEVLENCLQLSYESDVEYATQIVLTLLLSICREVSPNGREHRQHGIIDSMLKTELVISCIKISPNPQTHHHALLLLAHLAQMSPDQVLHDIIPIFTFVGTALIRHDDSYSYQIIDKIIENIVPKLIRGSDASDLKAVVPILKIFSSIVLDVPEHRRLTLFVKLLNTLGADKFLWPFVAVLLEHQVMIRKKQERQQQQQPQEDLPQRLHFALVLSKEFDLKTIISTVNSLIFYIKHLPMAILDQNAPVPSKIEPSIFCLKSHTNLQLRHYKYISAVFMKYLLESPEVLSKSQTLKEEDDEIDFQALISNSLLFIPTVTKFLDAHNNQSEKLTNLLLQNIYDVLEATIALLSPEMLLMFVEKLVEHESMHVRRRALEIFNKKLEDNYFSGCENAKLLKLLTPLRKICGTIVRENRTPIEEIVHQSALISIKILSRKYSEESSDVFVDVLEQLTNLLDFSDKIKKEVLACLVNTIAELIFDLKVLAINMLDKVLTSFVHLMTVQDGNRSTFQLIFAVSSSLLKIIETVPLFLSPYLKQMIQQISRVVPALKILQDPKIALTTGKISKIWTALAQSVPLRVLIPTVNEVYQKIAEKENFSSIEPLMELSYEIFQHAEGKELKNYQSELTDFFTRALEFRVVVQTKLNETEIDDLELLIIRSIVALVLKQSEGSFRPFFETIYEWGIKEGCQDGNYARAITFFRLTNEIAIALKSLFLLFASDVIDSAANLLNLSNPSKSDENLCFDDNTKNLYLTEYILRSLNSIFLHDHQNFIINSHRFEIIMQSVVDEIENELVVKDEGVQQLLRMTIAQLAVAASDDILWKQLNYQVLLKTRSDSPEVRILGLKVSVDVAKKLGEDFEPLIPETIPFLSELLEDDNHKVVEACQNGVRELESTVGDSLQKYF